VDNVGNRTAKTDQLAGVTSNYAYDLIYQLTGVTQGANTTESYSYDAVGNRLSSLGVSPYSYNVSNQLTSTPNATYTYDNNGNETSKTDSTGTTSYTWDYENRLTSVTLPGSGGTVSFKYDAFGRRIYKSSSAVTSIYAYDGDNLIEETNSSGGVVARYSQTDEVDEPLAMLRSGATSYYEADGLGTTTSLTNTAGSLAQTYTFDTFGKQTASSGSLTNPFQYAGRELDSETTLYFMRARYFDSTTGRFLSEDPARFDGGIDFYAYVSNSPVNLIDPFGLYLTHPKVPLPLPPALDKFMKCMDDCTKGTPPLYVRATTNGEHNDPGHKNGTTVDLRPNGTPSDQVFCCAGRCGAPYALDERKIHTPKGDGKHYHIQLVPPLHPNPKYPNAIPDRPECKPSGCDANSGAKK